MIIGIHFPAVMLLVSQVTITRRNRRPLKVFDQILSDGRLVFSFLARAQAILEKYSPILCLYIPYTINSVTLECFRNMIQKLHQQNCT